MAHSLLRLNKDAATAKLQLALFTSSLEDEKALGARVAHLEAELAGVALAHGRAEEALYAFIAAASAYKALGDSVAAASYLERAYSLKAGDDELKELAGRALADLRSKMTTVAAAPVVVAGPNPVKVELAAEEVPVEEPEAEEVSASRPVRQEPPVEEPKAEETPVEAPRRGRPKKRP